MMETILANALGQDVTKLAAEEKRLLLSRLLARFAHEIRNPLSSLDIHVQLLDEDLAQLAPQMREKIMGRFEIIHGELRRLENVVEQFIRLAGPSELDLATVEVAEIVRHVCQLLQPEAAARDIEITVQLGDDLGPIAADGGRLTQALLNLLINALQAIERRGRIVVRARPTKDDLVVIEVEDSGPGVPIEKQATIFEPYFSTKSEGSGLGLWIAQQIATAHGGAIRVANASGGGALFALLIPLRKPEPGHG